MKRINLFLTILLLTSGLKAFAQDGVFKNKKVELSFANIESEDSLMNLDLYQNDVFITSDRENSLGFRSMAKYDSLTGIYTLSYTYTGIGGGSSNLLDCPTLFVKLDFMNKNKQLYFQLIPISLKICGTTQLAEITVLTIDLNTLIKVPDKMIAINENNTYEILEREVISTHQLVKIEKKSSFYE